MIRSEQTGALACRVPPVLVLADHLGYDGGVAHGVGRYLQQVLPALRAAEIDLTACFLREPHAAAEPLRQAGIDTVFLSASRWDPSVVLKVAGIARGRGARLIHATGLKGTLVGRGAARLVNAGVILHTHDLNEPGPLVRVLQQLLARRTDLGIGVSEPARQLTVRGYHVAQERTLVLHNGIRLEAFQAASSQGSAEARARLDLPRGRQVLGMVGRMYPVKGHRAMLAMLPAILREQPDTVLLVVGDGPERAACAALVQELGVQDAVRFLGHRDDVPAVLAAMDILVMPSESEGLGLAAIEALAAGKPVVAFAAGGLREVISDRRNGRLVPAGDRAGFVNAVVELLRDEQQRRQYAEHAARDCMRFSLESHVQRLIGCYQRVAAAQTSRGTRPVPRGVLP